MKRRINSSSWLLICMVLISASAIAIIGESSDGTLELQKRGKTLPTTKVENLPTHSNEGAVLQANTWTQLGSIRRPFACFRFGLSYDSKSDKIIVFGGSPSNNETWAYDYYADTWTNMAPINSPSERVSPAIAYDFSSDKIIIFGGTDGRKINNETWAYDYDTNTWTNIKPIISPSTRDASAMVYDSKSDRIILFGGINNNINRYYDETWAYDYKANIWVNMTLAVKPAPRVGHDMVYDSESDRVILFGGGDNVSLGSDNETWAYDYNTNTWTNMNPANKPIGRSGHAMAYDSESDRTILFGGATPTIVNDTWAYDYNSNTWTEMNPNRRPSTRSGHGMAYDSKSDRVILFGGGGGSGETWAYELHTDTSSPFIVSTDPENGALEVETTSKITITFSEPMSTTTAENAVSISPGSITKKEWNSNGSVLTLTASLEEGTTYIVTISTEAKDLAGNAMLKAYTFSFTTKQEGISNTTIILSLLILAVIILLLVALLLIRRRREKSTAKIIASEGKSPNPSPLTEQVDSEEEKDKSKKDKPVLLAKK